MLKRVIAGTVFACVLSGISNRTAGADVADGKQQPQVAAGPSANAMLRAIAKGYRKNRESFTAFSCRFKWTTGRARSFEDARQGKVDNASKHDGLWIVDGQRVRYELVCTSVNLAEEFERAKAALNHPRSPEKEDGDLAPPKPSPAKRTLELPGQEYFCLRNDRWRARQSKLIKGINLVPPGVEDQAGIDVTPFALGMMGPDEKLSPAVLLSRVVDGQFVGQFEGTVIEDGRRLLAVACERKGGLRRSYRFDPERGYLPVQFRNSDSTKGKTYGQAFILEARNCGSGRWFPMRSIVVDGGMDGAWPKTVQETRVTELELRQPDAKEFFLDVPTGTQVSIVDSPNYVNIEKDRRVHESELDSLAEQAIAHHAILLERKKTREQLNQKRAANLKRNSP